MSEDASADRPVPAHIAIIMDGNGRWARRRGQPRAFGHRKGVETVRRIVEGTGDLGVKHLTLFSFSTENWRRPADEIGALFELMKHYIAADLEGLAKRGVRIRILGSRKGLREDVAEMIERSEARTRDNSDFHLNIAFNYGGRDEIVRATRAIAEAARAGELDPASLDEESFASWLDTSDSPDVDLMIRTSGEQRISNFLLWQAAYAELLFVDTLWPDFTIAQLADAIEAYKTRSRRYGGLDAGAA
ncbi:isoprenyl transferase [Maricaulis parjimensis]|uniref:isoprenyl transferase n=1 Tax=Maricaulis parjimensis TaxID=144023 RepID=UPI00193A7A93|nr:isoprenyl transferase [Maricaulis parjimensis]